MSRDQKPGRPKIIGDGSSRGRAGARPPAKMAMADSRADDALVTGAKELLPAVGSAPRQVSSPMSALLLASLFLLASGAAGVAVAFLPWL